MRRPFYGEEHARFREVAVEFVEREVRPHLERWDEDRLIDRDVWRAAARQGLIGLRIEDRFGGGGTTDYRYRCVLNEELARVGAAALASSFAINEDIVSSYLGNLGTTEQKERWLPGIAAGDLVCSIAMSEPGVGSDLRGMTTSATRDGDAWRISGAKTFITNGFSSDLVLVAARTGEDSAGRAALSLFVVETGTSGYTKGSRLRKLGLHAQDTAELFFDDVLLPAESLVGEEGSGFMHLTDQLPLERLSIGFRGLAAAEAALRWTLEYVRVRTVFGKPVVDYQNTRFRLAELQTEIDVTRSFVEEQVHRYNDGDLDAVTGAKVKWWSTELQKRVVDSCLQFFGGYGYMSEYPISRAYADARVQTIVGGTTEIMKEIIGRSLAKGI